MTARTKGSDLVLTLLFAVIAGAALGAAAGMAQNMFGWRSGFLVPALAGAVGASSIMFYRARVRRREQSAAVAPQP